MYQRILVPIDGSETSLLAVDEAIRLARMTGGRLRFLHALDQLSIAYAMDSYEGFSPDWGAALRENGQELLGGAKSSAVAAGVEADTVMHESFNDRLVDVVMAEARQWPADLIVLGTHGRRGIRRLLLGSGAQDILRAACVPVLMVRAQEPSAETESAGGPAHVSLPSAALSME